MDAAQGVEAQTLANVYLALDHDLDVMPVINKVDLPSAQPDEVFQEAKELGLELIAEQYNIMLLQLFSEEKEDVLPEKIKAFEQELEKYMEQSGNLIVAKQSRAEYDFVLKGTGQQSLAETTEQVKSLLAEYFRRETAVEYVAALGTPVERFSELQQCYRQTNLCFSRRYSVERNQILEEETPGELCVCTGLHGERRLFV